MDRRRFLRGSAIIGAVAASGGRLEGAGPGATEYTHISDTLRLHLSLGGISPSNFAQYGALAYLATDVLLNATAASSFTTNPAAYLTAAGYNSAEIDTTTKGFQLAVALANPTIRQAALTGDPVQFYNTLWDNGYLAQPTPLNRVFIIANVVALIHVVAAMAVVVAVSYAAAIFVFLPAMAWGAMGQIQDETTLAAALGGAAFANSVERTAVVNSANAVIAAIENGTIAVPPGMTQAQAISAIQAAVAVQAP
jgi:hypothetical protein